MPELPELEVIKERFNPLVVGKIVQRFKILKPYVLKSYLSDNLQGEQIQLIRRRGKYLEFSLVEHSIYVHLMLHGSVHYIPASARIRKSANALLLLEDGAIIEFSEKTAKKRMSIYIKKKSEPFERVENLGIEPLSNTFTVQRFECLLKEERKQLKNLLCRQSKIAGIGNAYADEILWKAGLSPFKLSADLSDTEIRTLHDAIIDVLNWAIQEVRKTQSMDKRNFLHIHGKRGQKCPKCGDSIRIVSFAHSETFYCPNCQTSGHKLKDRRMSKFYR
jgi:DNA-formamidopyrimidine glycosylase